MSFSRRDFISTAIAAPVLISTLRTANAAGEVITFKSPNGKVQFILFAAGPQLRYRVTRANHVAIDLSPLGILVDGADLCRDSRITKIERYRVSEKYLTRGGHSTARDNGNGAKISLRHTASKADYVLDVRAYNDGIAFRYVVPGSGNRVPDEATAFTIPAGSTTWFHDFAGHYEGVHQKKDIGDVKDGEWAAPPLTIKLPGNAGFAAITEGALVNYAGMGLQADGRRGFKVVLGHALPISHPFDLRYGKEEAKRLSRPAAIEGEIKTPWRVVMIGKDLNTLVNCDIVNSVSSPPDKTIFPAGLKTDWVKPGRAVWRYLDGGENTFEGMKEFSRLAGQLGFEYNVVEGLWQRWPESQMRELADYSRQQNVGLWFWKHSRALRTPQAREDFFSLLSRVGVVGAKIDFFDHEAKEIVDVYQALLRSSAEHKIMVEFHGANKPAGESRSWPNEMTREAVRGLEYRSMSLRSKHNTTLPFTRFLAGHADYTPVHFGERRRETSWAHQIASAIVFTSPLMIYGAHPQHILDNPAAELIKTIPSVWDETIVLPQSEIGELAAFARRSGDVWFVGIMNGLAGRTIRISLQFLGKRKHKAMLVRDQMDEPAAVKIENASIGISDSLVIGMRAGGGFVGRFDPVSRL
ncbi:MAG TPA: glycoside hydrolase family 97 catalytic domain-containing protein [Pyrinomonadaceae bacterium]